VFERFTEPARQVVVLAQDEARGLGQAYLGTEHLLLGLIREDRGAAARVLASAGVGQEAVRARAAATGVGSELKTGQIPFSPNGRLVLEQSLREAVRRKHAFIGTEHILLGVVTVEDSAATRILSEIGADAGSIRDQLRLMIGSL
jgi:ATP-dependent Clp protease ATP-binding subunit ClpC